jgi:hypothetical protein
VAAYRRDETRVAHLSLSLHPSAPRAVLPS